MSLLDDVSIVVTPNGYKAGTLYGAVPIPTEGAEEVTNGTFTGITQAELTVGSEWTTGAGWTISGGEAVAAAGTSSKLEQSISGLSGKFCKVNLTLSDYGGGGSAYIDFGSTNSSYINTNGEHTVYGAFDQNKFEIFKGGAFSGSIDNISVKEYTSADMDVTRATAATRVDEDGLVNYAEIIGGELLNCNSFNCADPAALWSEGSGWSFSGGKAIYDGTGGTSPLAQSDVIEVGKTYRVSIEVLSNEGTGANTIFLGGTVLSAVNLSVGTHVFYGATNNTSVILTIYGRSGEVFEIGSVSVKEVTRDNVPRIDYTGGGCPHILAEPQRTNLLTYSEDFSQSFWNQTTADITVTTNTNPSGTSGTYLVENVTGSQLGASFSITSGNDYTASWYVRSISGTGAIVIKDTNNSPSNFTATSEWQRFSVTANATGAGRCYIQVASGDEIEVWGAQFEEGSYATSYIPTSGSTVTRNQDIFTRDGIGSLINDSEGVLFAEIAALSDDETNREITLSDGIGSNYVLIRFNSGGSNRIYTRVDVGGAVEYYDLNTSHTITNNNKIAIRWGASNFATFINGVKVGSQLSGSSFSADTLNELNFDNGTGGSPFNGKVKQLQVYKTALTDTQLAALTS